MSWSIENFRNILATELAVKLLENPEIAEYTSTWRQENKAALLHANGITEESNFKNSLKLLQLIAAFGKKDISRMDTLINQDKVTVGARLDYLLPLYDEANEGGEDVFVAATKILLGGTCDTDVSLVKGNMQHKFGEANGSDYSESELRGIENYVNNSFEIRAMLASAPNKTIVRPTRAAVKYMLHNPTTYHDSNGNPPIVFFPGAISIDSFPIEKILDTLIKKGALVDDIGFFGVTGIVWSIILGDVAGVRKFIELGANCHIEDEMGNPSVCSWIGATQQAVGTSQSYLQRLNEINGLLSSYKLEGVNYLEKTASDYLIKTPIQNGQCLMFC